MAVFEILSPEDRFSRMMRRFREFEQMGVSGIYFISPENGRFMRYHERNLIPVVDIEVAGRHVAARKIADQVH